MSDDLIGGLIGKIFMSVTRSALKNAADGLIAKGLLSADQRDIWVQGIVDDIEIGLKLSAAGGH